MGGSVAFWMLLDEAERASLQAAGSLRKFQPGETLIGAVSTDRNVVIILDGSARVVADAGNGKAALLAIRGPGDIVGELSVLDGRPRYATVEAASQLRGLVLRHAPFAAALKVHPRIMDLLTAVATERLREADRRRVEFATSSVLPRAAGIILEFAERSQLSTMPLQLNIISQADIAGLLAISRESIARALAELRTRGIISTARGRINILDINKLRDVAGK